MNKIVVIYAIVRLETREAYVGSTIAKSARWRTHRYQLRSGKHHCRYLQNAWNKYGEAAFDFIVLHEEPCSSHDERIALETSWIMTHGTYNTLVASDRSGVFALRIEDREKRRDAALAHIAADPAFAEKLAQRGSALAEAARTPEARAAMSAHSQRRWHDPDERLPLAQGLVNRWAVDGARERQAEKTGARMRVASNARAHSEKLKAAWADPEKSAKLRQRLDSRWSDPDAKARQSAALKAAWARRKGTT